MSSYSGAAGAAETSAPARRSTHSHETKPAYKTTEFIIYLLAVIAVLIASAVVDKGDNGQGFSAQTAWMFITWLTIGYMVSRGLAKSGSAHRGGDTDS
jgi:di/tricarboxylate transporter